MSAEDWHRISPVTGGREHRYSYVYNSRLQGVRWRKTLGEAGLYALGESDTYDYIDGVQTRAGSCFVITHLPTGALVRQDVFLATAQEAMRLFDEIGGQIGADWPLMDKDEVPFPRNVGDLEKVRDVIAARVPQLPKPTKKARRKK